MLQLILQNCSFDEVGLLETILEEFGAVSVTLTDQHDHAILEPAPGEAPLWPTVTMHLLYLEEVAAISALEAVATGYEHLSPQLQYVPEQDWERVCLRDLAPQKFGTRLWVCPSWLEPPDKAAVNLILDPGLAFGTGTHPTTSLCLTWLEQAALTHQEIIDYGCGSGILAVAALKLGAHHVYAVDIDAQALLATQNNAFNNGILASQISVSQPEHLVCQVDCLVANILLKPLLELKQRFHQLLKPGGNLVVSGILASQASELIDAYQPQFSHQELRLDGDWGLLVFVNNNDMSA